LSKRRPSVKASSSPKVFDSSTVTTPSGPTRSMASATSSPISGSSLAEMVATWAIWARESTAIEASASWPTRAASAASKPRLRAIGLAPAMIDRRAASSNLIVFATAVLPPAPDPPLPPARS
jgi:hypothetical protein